MPLNIPDRPSEISATARQIDDEGEEVTIRIRVDKRSRQSIHVRAAERGKSLKSYVLGLCKADGCTIIEDTDK
jgi:hypothetical protein